MQLSKRGNTLEVVLSFGICSKNGCLERVWASSKYCKEHQSNPVDYHKELIGWITEDKKELDSRDLSGIILSNTNLEGIDFRFCRFTGAVFKNVSFQNSRFFMCLLDDISAADCNFNSSAMLSVVAAGSDFTNADFEDSNLINVNFNGIKGDFAIFNGSDLFSSRFIAASLNNAQFQDCNLKLVDFTKAELQKTNFFDSNPGISSLMEFPGQ